MANSAVVITKDLEGKMIEKIKELYPELFEAGDFRVNHIDGYAYNEIKRYYISIDFNNREIYGHFDFLGDDLAFSGFSLYRQDNSTAVFPPQISRAEAEKMAISYLEKHTKLADFDIEATMYRYPRSITEPIEYSFTIYPKHNGIRISNENYSITILADGFVTRFSTMTHSPESASFTFEAPEDLLTEEKIRTLLIENLELELSYVNHQDKNRELVKLIYNNKADQHAVDAKTGKFLSMYPMPEQGEAREIKPLSDQPLPSRGALTEAEIEQHALKLLTIDSDEYELRINRVYKDVNFQGQAVYRVDYSYSYRHGSMGSSIEFLENGELLHFGRHFPFYDPRLGVEKEINITEEEALEKAIAFIKEYAGSVYHEFAYPLHGARYEEYNNSYSIFFQRQHEGILFNHNNLSVNISAKDGSIQSYYRSYTQSAEPIPQPSEAQAIDEIIEAYVNGLKIELMYHRMPDSKHYELLYRFYPNPPAQFNAVSAEWERFSSVFGIPDKSHTGVTHPWAEDELNFLIDLGAIVASEETNFNQGITVGEGLEVLVKSLGRFWPGYYSMPYRETKLSFEHVDAEHPLYEVVEFAVQSRIISKEDKLDLEAKLTREQFAVWVVRILDREDVAKKQDIFKVEFKDAAKIAPSHVGYVVLADAYGILSSKNGYIQPDREMSLAQLAVATLRLGTAMTQRRY